MMLNQDTNNTIEGNALNKIVLTAAKNGQYHVVKWFFLKKKVDLKIECLIEILSILPTIEDKKGLDMYFRTLYRLWSESNDKIDQNKWQKLSEIKIMDSKDLRVQLCIPIFIQYASLQRDLLKYNYSNYIVNNLCNYFVFPKAQTKLKIRVYTDWISALLNNDKINENILTYIQEKFLLITRSCLQFAVIN